MKIKKRHYLIWALLMIFPFILPGMSKAFYYGLALYYAIVSFASFCIIIALAPEKTEETKK